MVYEHGASRPNALLGNDLQHFGNRRTHNRPEFIPGDGEPDNCGELSVSLYDLRRVDHGKVLTGAGNAIR